MELVYCFFGMAAFCATMCIIFDISGLISLHMNKEHIADKSLNLSYSFMNCALFFLFLEIAARFFA